jgi:hypothetical protein
MRREVVGATLLQAVAALFALVAVFIGIASRSAAFQSVFEGDLVAGSLGAAHRAAEIAPFKVYVYGVLGGSLIGFAASVFAIARFGIARREKWAWWAVLASSVLWYALDTGGSLRAGVLMNAAGNTIFLAIILAALGISARACLSKGDDAGTARP